MLYRLMCLFWMVSLVGLLNAPVNVLANEPGESYVLQADDDLARLAEKYYQTPLAGSLIVQATNQRAQENPLYAALAPETPPKIGQRLYISPPAAVAEALAALTAALALTPEQRTLLDSLDVLGVPPELENEVWFNAEPLKLGELHGQVVLLEFWTFG